MVFSQFAISVFQIGFVFLYLGMIHLAGYRWDILRRAPSVLEKTEVSVDGIPPVLSPMPSAHIGCKTWSAPFVVRKENRIVSQIAPLDSTAI